MWTKISLRRAQRLTPVVSIQNRYNLEDRRSEPLVDLCEQEQLVFLPWAPIQDLDGNPVVREIARNTTRPLGRSCSPGCSPARRRSSRSPVPQRFPTLRRT